MATLLETYRDNKIFRNIGGNDRPSPADITAVTATPKAEPSLLQNEDAIKKFLKTYYSSLSIVNVNYSGRSAEPLVMIKPNEDNDKYNNRLQYTLTRAEATGNWLKSPNGLLFLAEQTVLQTFNPQLETKLYKPNSVLSNLIPYTGYHERRHMTLSNLFGLPLNLSGFVPANYTEAIYATPYKSRNVYQSPLTTIGKSEEFPGLEYAIVGQTVMTSPSTWVSLNPDRYAYPIGADGGGLPNSSAVSPNEELRRNMQWASQGVRFTRSTGFNPSLDAQVTMNDQLSGTSFLQNLLRKVPFVNTIMSIFGYGLIKSVTEVKIFNPYNVTFPYSAGKGKIIRVINKDGALLDSYDVTDNKTPLERMLYAIEQAIIYSNEKAQSGMTFAPKATFPNFDKYASGEIDDRVITNPQNQKLNLNNYLQSYGDIMDKRAADKNGAASSTGAEKKPYSKFLVEDNGDKIIYRIDGFGFSNPGSRRKDDRTPDLINMLEYGEDSADKNFSDLIPFKFFHINENKWIVFRATLTGLTDSLNPEWNEKSYIGRADKLYVYKGASRKINFSFKIMVESARELRPLYTKLNYLMGLVYPKYKSLSGGYGQYMEAPFIRLTIGDLFDNVYGILDSGLTITYPDDITWETRDKDPDGNDIAKVPRSVEISVSSFTPFSLDNKPVSSTSPFYSMIKKWQGDS